MLENTDAKEFWQKKILKWEALRYAPWTAIYPPSWPLRHRLRQAHRGLIERAAPDCSLLELGCGSGLLAEKLHSRFTRYHGIDIAHNAIDRARTRAPMFTFETADVSRMTLPSADITLFFGLTDWLHPARLDELFGKIKSPLIFFSFTEPGRFSPYLAYRSVMDRPRPGVMKARTYTTDEIANMMCKHGFSFEQVTKPTALNPGSIAWGTRAI